MRFYLLLSALLIGAMAAGPAHAATQMSSLPANECDISNSAQASSPCPSPYSAVGPTAQAPALYQFSGARSIAGAQANAAIDAYGTARYIDNSSGNSIFVPFASKAEWTAFLNNLPAGVSAIPAAVPVPLPPATSPNQLAIYPGSSCTTPSPAYYLIGVPYYARPATTITTPPLSPMVFQCTSGGGTDFTQWTQTVSDIVYVSASKATNAGVVPWSASALYSGAPPTVTLTATPNSVAANATVTLSWTSTGATSCLSPADGTTLVAANGSVTVTPSQTTSYNIVCNGQNGSAGASVSVTVSAADCPQLNTSDTIYACMVDPTSAMIDPNETSVNLYGAAAGCEAYDQNLSQQRIINSTRLTYTSVLPASTIGQSYTVPAIGSNTRYVWYIDYAQYKCTASGWTECVDAACSGPTGGGPVDTDPTHVIHNY